MKVHGRLTFPDVMT